MMMAYRTHLVRATGGACDETSDTRRGLADEIAEPGAGTAG